MNIIRTGVIFIILTTLGILFDRYKKKYWGDEELDKYFREKYGVKEPEKVGMNTVDETTPVQRTSALPEINTPPLPEQAMPSPQVVGSRPQAPGVMQSGLTPSETALLSDEEKMIRLRQRGLA